jgi:hypothetical protein
MPGVIVMHRHLSGFTDDHATEALPGTPPKGRNALMQAAFAGAGHLPRHLGAVASRFTTAPLLHRLLRIADHRW